MNTIEGEASSDLGSQLLARTGPLEESPRRRRLVWERLQASAKRQRYRYFQLVPVFLLVTAGATAAIQTWGGEKEREQVALPDDPDIQAARTMGALGEPTRETQVQTQETEIHDPAEQEQAEQKQAEQKQAEQKRGTTTVSQAAKKSSASKVVQDAREVELLWQAMQARQSGDTEKVRQLTEEYRAKNPTGELGEEALALALEAALARSDPQAITLAREYLRRFPQGRFVAQAQSALNKNAAKAPRSQ
jgi:hypothetical protein